MYVWKRKSLGNVVKHLCLERGVMHAFEAGDDLKSFDESAACVYESPWSWGRNIAKATSIVTKGWKVSCAAHLDQGGQECTRYSQVRVNSTRLWLRTVEETRKSPWGIHLGSHRLKDRWLPVLAIRGPAAVITEYFLLDGCAEFGGGILAFVGLLLPESEVGVATQIVRVPTDQIDMTLLFMEHISEFTLAVLTPIMKCGRKYRKYSVVLPGEFFGMPPKAAYKSIHEENQKKFIEAETNNEGL